MAVGSVVLVDEQAPANKGIEIAKMAQRGLRILMKSDFTPHI